MDQGKDVSVVSKYNINERKFILEVSNYNMNKNNIKRHIRRKRGLPFKYNSKKEKCKSLQIDSANNEAWGNINSVVAGVASSVTIMGFSVGAFAAAPFAGMSMHAYEQKRLSDIAYIEQDCDDIPFDEIKEILGEKFESVDKDLDRNYDAIKRNLEEIHRNYALIKRVKDNVEKNLVAIQTGFTVLNDNIRKTNTEEVTSKLITFIELFSAKQSALKHLPFEDLVNELQADNGILHHLQASKLPQLDSSLHGLLSDIMNRRFAIPKSPDDDIALATLALLCLGIDTYISILSFLLSAYNFLGDISCQDGDVEACNQYFSTSFRTLKDFTNYLNGIDDRNGLLDKVIGVLNEIKSLDFIKTERSVIVDIVSRKIAKFSQIKSDLVAMNDLPNKKHKEKIKYSFTESAINTPFLEWQNRTKVSYAVQYRIDGVNLRVGDWSVPYTVYGKACPMLDIGIAPRGITRHIFRKFDSEKPQLVGIIEDRNQTQFRDIHRDLYNSAFEANEEIALQDMAKLINEGANVTTTFEKGRQAVHAAAEAGNLKAVLYLLENGADMNAPDGNGYTPLHIAAESGYENFIKELIQHGADVNATTHLNRTALHVAAENDHVNSIKSLLLNDQIDINVKDTGGFSPLHIAVSSNNMDAVAVFLSDTRIDVNSQSKKNLAPLHLAALGGYEEIAETLLNNDRRHRRQIVATTSQQIDVNLGTEGNLTALHLASIANNVKIVERLIAHKETDINAISSEGWNPLHLAISLKKESVIRTLLNTTGINVDAEGKNKMTPIHLASSTGQNTVVLELLDRDVQINAREESGFTALSLAAKEGHLDTVKLLIGRGANVDFEDKTDEVALQLGICSKHTEIVHYFIEEFSPFNIHIDLNRPNIHNGLYTPNQKTFLHPCKTSSAHKLPPQIPPWPMWLEQRGNPTILRRPLPQYFWYAYCKSFGSDMSANNTLLHYAAHRGCLEAVKYLIESKKFDSNIENDQGETPLHLAASGGNLEVIKYLIDRKGEDVNIKTSRISKLEGYNTPLHYAAREGNLNIVKYLVDDKMASINVKNAKGETPLHLAAFSGNLELVKYLIETKKVHLVNGVNDPPWVIFNSPLHYAAFSGNLAVVKYIFEKKEISVNNSKDENSSFIFFLKSIISPILMHLVAAFSGNLEIVKYINENEELNTENWMFATFLYSAIFSGNLEMVKYFIGDDDLAHLITGLNNAHEFRETIRKIGTTLHVAALSGNLEVVKYLIEAQQVDLNVTNEMGDTPIHFASLGGNLEMVKYFIEVKEVSFNDKNSDDETVVHFAAFSGNLELVRYLVEDKELEFNVKNSQGNTPLFFAVSGGYIDVVKYLIDDKHVDFNAKNLEGVTILHLVISNNNLEMAKYLVGKKGVSFNMKNDAPETFLREAIEMGHIDVLKYIIETTEMDCSEKNTTSLPLARINDNLETVKDTKDADFTIKCFDGEKSLLLQLINRLTIIAVQHGNLKILKYFIEEKQADLFIKDSDGRTFLHLAVMSEDLQKVKYFLSTKRLYPYARDKHNRTPLNYAIFHKSQDILEYLIDVEGQNFKITDDEGNTLMHHAVRYGTLAATKFLLEHRLADLNLKNHAGKTPLDISPEVGWFLPDYSVRNYVESLKKNFPRVNRKNRRSIEADKKAQEKKIISISANRMLLVSNSEEDANENNHRSYSVHKRQPVKSGSEINIESRGRNYSRLNKNNRPSTETYKTAQERKLASILASRRILVNNSEEDANKKHHRSYIAQPAKNIKSNKKQTDKNGSEMKNQKMTKDSYLGFINFGINDKALTLTSEIPEKYNDVKLLPTIHDGDETSTYSAWLVTNEVMSYKNVPFVKWLFHSLGLHGFVKRMIHAEQSAHKVDYESSGLSENLYWIEKRLNTATRLYDEEQDNSSVIHE